ncbi:hypothetical protein J4405_05385 [Candidatus Woesearchaeota archaeon]|nr:hypothetical protein [Candidatus Woesearchaeota archaeon]
MVEMVLRLKNLMKKQCEERKKEIMHEIEHLRLIDLNLMYSLGNHWRWNNGKFY